MAISPKSGSFSRHCALLLLFIVSSATSFAPGMKESGLNNPSSHQPSNGEESSSSSLSSPLFSVGLIADIQYAPIPDGHSYSGVPRYYRHSLDTARTAFNHFQQEQVPLVINLGDSVDGKAADAQAHGGDPVPQGVDPGHAALDDVVDALSNYRHGKILHAYGNHCLYAADRPSLQSKLGIPFVQEPCGDLVGYYSHSHQGIRFVVVDSYDIAKMQRCDKHSLKYKQAVDILMDNNHNYHENENSPEGLPDLQRRFVAFNGAVGPIQLDWLRQQLQDAQKANEKVIVLSHQPIHPASTNPTCLMWNYHDVLEILREYSDVVMASFSGHAHKGGYARDETSGIHFRVLEAALENPHPHKTYAFVDVWEDRLKVRGVGNCESAEYDLSHLVRRKTKQDSVDGGDHDEDSSNKRQRTDSSSCEVAAPVEACQ